MHPVGVEWRIVSLVEAGLLEGPGSHEGGCGTDEGAGASHHGQEGHREVVGTKCCDDGAGMGKATDWGEGGKRQYNAVQ